MNSYTFHVSLPGAGRVWRKIELRGDQTLEDLHWAIQTAFDFDGDHLYSFFMSGRAWDDHGEYRLPEGADPWGLERDEEEQEPESALEAALAPEELEALLAELTPEKLMADLKALADDPVRVQALVGILKDPILTKRRRAEQMAALTSPALSLFLQPELPGDVRQTTLDQLELTVGQKFLYLFDYGDSWQFRVRVHALNPAAPPGDYPRYIQSVGQAPEQYRPADDEGWPDDARGAC